MSAASHPGRRSGPASQTTAPVPANVADQAVQWLIELQAGDPSPRMQEQWLRWRALHPDNERAWQRIESVSGSMRGLPSPLKSALAQATLTPKHSPQRRHAIKTLAALVFVTTGAWTAQDLVPWRQWTAQHRTRIGERNTLLLDDGSQLVMNTDSAIDVAFTASERRVRLVAGEILVTTARDPETTARPFLIETAQGEARALGTRYAVRQLADATLVSVYEAAVAIHPRHSGERHLVLQAGEQSRFTATEITSPWNTEESNPAWASGMIIARGLRLEDFLAELCRYSRLPISCDAGVAGLRVSGSYPLADIGKVLDTLATLFSLEVQHVTRFWGGTSLRLTRTQSGTNRVS